MICAACKGTGAVERETNRVVHRYGQEFDEDVPTISECDDCDGTGEVPVLTRLIELRDRVRQMHAEIAQSAFQADDLLNAGHARRAVAKYNHATGRALGALESIEHDLQLWLLDIGVR